MLNTGFQPVRMIGILRYDQHKRFNQFVAGIIGEAGQFRFYVFMMVNTVFQLNFFQLFFGIICSPEVFARGNGRNFDISIFQRSRKRIVINYVSEITGICAHRFRRGG